MGTRGLPGRVEYGWMSDRIQGNSPVCNWSFTSTSKGLLRGLSCCLVFKGLPTSSSTCKFWCTYYIIITYISSTVITPSQTPLSTETGIVFFELNRLWWRERLWATRPGPPSLRLPRAWPYFWWVPRKRISRPHRHRRSSLLRTWMSLNSPLR